MTIFMNFAFHSYHNDKKKKKYSQIYSSANFVIAVLSQKYAQHFFLSWHVIKFQ